jgi:RimJ/RimL family protein N-acetyltransferase
LLEGKNVNLRVIEKDDMDFELGLINDMDLWGEYNSVQEHISKSEWIKRFDNPPAIWTITELRRFIVLKKDGTRIGFVSHSINPLEGQVEIGYNIIPSERGKGFGTEAAQLMVDYLFLSKNVVRIQATTNVKNKASQRVLEKTGFTKEGTCRKSGFVRGVWTDSYLYSILREEWKEPKILTKTA